MGNATGETYSFAEGKLYLYASASGTTSGSGVGFATNAEMGFSYGWMNYRNFDGNYHNLITGKYATLSIENLLADTVLFNLANASAAVNAKFESLTTGVAAKSANWVLYSGVIDSLRVNQSMGDLHKFSISLHANVWSAFG